MERKPSYKSLFPRLKPGIVQRAERQSRIRQIANLLTRVRALANEAIQGAEDCERVFAQQAFYAEFVPQERHSHFVDSIYILKDQGRLTASRLTFASPFRELTFSYRDSADGVSGRSRKVAVNGPSFGHRRKGRAFFGWIIGIKFKPSWPGSLRADAPPVVACQNSLARIISERPSGPSVLDPVDQLLLALSQPTQGASKRRDYFETPHYRVADLASHVGRSVRTLHRRIKASTGLAPKRFLTMQRFRRAVHDIATQNIGLSLIASDLGFSDQAHLSREFRRHAGVSPGAFKQAWRGRDARAVRFLQDTGSGTRLRLAVWSNEVSPDSI